MCWLCDHPDATFATYVDEQVQPMIDQRGWAVQSVTSTSTRARFRYTVGLTVLGLPELVVTGRPPHGAVLLNALAPRIGEAKPGTQLRWHGIALEVVDVPHPEAHLFTATGLYGEDRVRARQLAWADSQGRWPWDPGAGGQPVLGPRAAPLRRAG